MTTDPRGEALNLELKALMVRRRLTQSEFSRALGMSQPQLSERLRGSIQWRITELWRAAEILGANLPALLAGIETDSPAAIPA